MKRLKFGQNPKLTMRKLINKWFKPRQDNQEYLDLIHYKQDPERFCISKLNINEDDLRFIRGEKSDNLSVAHFIVRDHITDNTILKKAKFKDTQTLIADLNLNFSKVKQISEKPVTEINRPFLLQNLCNIIYICSVLIVRYTFNLDNKNEKARLV